MDTPNAVSVHGLSKSFRTGFLGRRVIEAVSGLTLEIPRGSISALLGPNGSGKTTLLRMLVGLSRPTSGIAEVLCMPPGSPDALTRIGFLPESPGLLPNLTALENVSLYARMRGIPARERGRRACALLDMFGLSDSANRRVSQFSTGMLKRTGLCQVLVHEPELLILDEPASGLDPVSSATLEEILKKRCNAGGTAIVSSHLLWRVESVADLVCVMNHGKLAAFGGLEAVAGIPGAFEVRVSGGAPDEARKALENAGFMVESSGPARNTLEQVFLRLTRGAEGETR